MKVEFEIDTPPAPTADDMVGNVYQVRGGMGARLGHMHVIVSSYEYRDCCGSGKGFVTLTINRDGNIVGGNSYAHHYFMGKTPIANCHGLEDVHLIVRSL